MTPIFPALISFITIILLAAGFGALIVYGLTLEAERAAKQSHWIEKVYVEEIGEEG